MRGSRSTTERAFALTRNGAMHASSTDVANMAAAALAGLPDGTTLVTVNESGALRHVIVTDDVPVVKSSAHSAGKTMNARATELDIVPDLQQSSAFAKVVVPRDAKPMYDTQMGAEFTTLSKVIGDLLMPGEWVAMGMRRVAKRERGWHDRWLTHHGQMTHHSRLPGAVAVNIWTGAADASRARHIASSVAAAIPGFGLQVTAQSVSAGRSAQPWILGAVAGAAVAIGAPMLGAEFPVPWFVPVAGWCAFGVAALAAVGLWRGVLPSEHRTLMSLLPHGRVPAPSKRALPPRKPEKERLVYRNGEQQLKAEVPGEYPMSPDSFIVGPHLPLALIAPHSNASGGQETGERPAPPVMRERIGPRIGVNLEDEVRLDYSALWAGLAVLGQAGSGKTALLEHLWGSASAERVRPTGVRGMPERHALIAFDTKGDGQATEQYAAWLRHNDDKMAAVVHAFDPASPLGIDLFPDLGDGVFQWARRVTSAMAYVMGADSVGRQSMDTLNYILPAAKLIADNPFIVKLVTGHSVRPGASPFYYASLLLTNQGDEVAVELAMALAGAAANPVTTTTELVEATARLAPMYGPNVTRSQRASLASAPRTKVSALLAAETWWSKPQKNTWETLLTHDVATIVNLGSGPSRNSTDGQLRSDLAGLMVYTLMEEIKRVCIGWWDQKRAVSVFADEVKHLANQSPEVIKWMREDARSNGVRAVFATQTPETLNPEVRRTMLGFGTLVLFGQNEPSTVREIVADLQLDGGAWDSSDVVNLPQYHAIVRATADGRRQEPFTVRIPDYRGEREAGTWAA